MGELFCLYWWLNSCRFNLANFKAAVEWITTPSAPMPGIDEVRAADDDQTYLPSVVSHPVPIAPKSGQMPDYSARENTPFSYT